VAVQTTKKRYSWVPIEKARAQLSSNKAYIILIGLDGSLYSLNIELLLEVVAGHRESLRIFKCENHDQR
jgi:hypothetical protein